MRARRSKKLTQSQFAAEIQEPETAIKMIEEGFVPEETPDLISKIERYLDIRIKKIPEISYGFSSSQIPSPEEDSGKKEIKEQFLRDFNINSARGLKVSDLKEIGTDKKEDSYKLVNPDESLDPFEERDKRQKEDIEEKELSNEEIDRILYGE